MVVMLAIAAAGCDSQTSPAAPTGLDRTPSDERVVAESGTNRRPEEANPTVRQPIGNSGHKFAAPQSDSARCQTIHNQLSTIVGSRQSGPTISDARYIYRSGPANDSLRFAWGPPSWLQGHVIGYWHRVRRLQPGPSQNWGGWHWSATTRTYSRDGLNEPSPWGPGDTPKYSVQVRVCHKTNGTVYVHRRKGSASSRFTIGY